MYKMANQFWKIGIDKGTGAIISIINVKTGYELISEPQLAASFRLCVPQEDYLCNYVEGTKNKASNIKEYNTGDGLQGVEILIEGMESDCGKLDIDLVMRIELDHEKIYFKSKLTNKTLVPISEFWFPMVGGIKSFNNNRDSGLAIPGYFKNCRHDTKIFKQFPGGMGLGSPYAEFSSDYPGQMMPWWDIYDEKNNQGLYMGYHDETFRFSTWHAALVPHVSGHSADNWLTAETAAGLPVGLVFSHVRYPFISKGEEFDSGCFILRLHEGDWHDGAQYYRSWFMKHFPFDKSGSWLRKKSAWFSSIIFQPEDKIVTDFEGYDRWCKEASEYGVSCHELIGWDKGGLERDYPEYVPEEKIGGLEGFRKLLKSIDERGEKCLVFVNYNILDSCTKWYKEELHKYCHQDIFGNTPNWMAWGESTLLARKGLNVRRHHLASVVPELVKILEDKFLELVKDGAHGFQIDKMCVGSALDFNPLNTEKPDVASCEGLIRAIAGLFEKCTAINPDFRIASEAVQDRLLPYIDVFYRNSSRCDISPLRFVFPEWTSCQHVGAPFDFNGINGAVLTGSVICVEPQTYQASLNHPIWNQTAKYIEEVEKIRNELKDIIFTGKYYDNLYARICAIKGDFVSGTPKEDGVRGEVMIPGGGGVSAAVSTEGLNFAVHGNSEGDKLAIVVVNMSEKHIHYKWGLMDCEMTKGYSTDKALLYRPFKGIIEISSMDELEIKNEELHIIVLKRQKNS